MAKERVTTILDAEEHVSEAAKKASSAIQGFEKQNTATSQKLKVAWTEVLAKYLIISRAIQKVAQVFDGLVKAYSVQENAERRLAVAIRQNPLLNGDGLGRFKAFAAEVQRTTIFGDEQVLQATSFAAAAGLAEEQIRKIGVTAAQIASSGIMGYEAAVENLTKTYSGQIGLLGRSVPAVAGLTAEQLKHGAAVDIVAQAYGGMAGAIARSVEGVHTRLGNLSGDIQETLGGVFGLLRKKMEEQLIPVLEGINKWFTDNAPNIYGVFSRLPQIMAVAMRAAVAIIRQALSPGTFGDVLGLLAQGVATSIVGSFVHIVTGFKNLILDFVDIAKEFGSDFWRFFFEGFLNVATTVPRALLKVLGVADLKFDLGGSNRGAIQTRTQGAVTSFGQEVFKGVTDNLKNMGTTAVAVGDIFKDTLAPFLTEMGVLVGEGAAEFVAYQAEAAALAAETDRLKAAFASTANDIGSWWPRSFGPGKSGIELRRGSDGGIALVARMREIADKLGPAGDMVAGVVYRLADKIDAVTVQIAEDLGRFADAVMEGAPASANWAMSIVEAAAAGDEVGAVLAALQPLFAGLWKILAPAMDTIIKPLVGWLNILGQIVGHLLAPVFSMLGSFLQAFMPIIVNGFNFLLPVINLLGKGLGFLAQVVDVVSRPFEWIGDLIGWVGAKLRYFVDTLPFIGTGTVANPGAFSSDAFRRAIISNPWTDIAPINMDLVNAAGSEWLSDQTATGGETSVQRPPDINVYVAIHGPVIGGLGLAEIGKYVGEALEAHLGTGGVLHIEAGVVP